MTERLTESQEKTARRGSHSMERAWRVYNRPREFSLEEVEGANAHIVQQMKNLKLAIDIGTFGIDPEVFDRVFMGIYHRGIKIPPELKYKDPKRN